MKLTELIGKKVLDILEKVDYESFGLDNADSYIVLSDSLLIGIPWSIDEDELVWERETDLKAISVLNGSVMDENVRGKRIVDLLFFAENESGFAESEKVIIEVEGERFFTECTVAMNGTGHAGVWYFNTKAEMEKRYGQKYTRLSSTTIR